MSVSVSRHLPIAALTGGACLFVMLVLLPGQSPEVRGQSQEEAARRSAGCVSCHGFTEAPSMHTTGTVQLACIDCHGGEGDVMRPAEPDMRAYERARRQAHPKSSNGSYADSSANPVRGYTDWLNENKEYIRFINPGDLRVVDETCGNCHAREARAVQTSMMTHGGMLWQAALYNTGAYPYKNARFGESYSPCGWPSGE